MSLKPPGGIKAASVGVVSDTLASRLADEIKAQVCIQLESH